MIKKSPYLFFSYLESMNYEYLQGHDFNKMSDFLNDKFLTQYCMPLLNSKMAEFKRESLVDVGCNVIQSRHQNKCGYFSMQERSATFMFCPSLYISIYPALEKIMPYSHCVVFIEWSHKKTADTNNSGPTIFRFE